MGKKLSSVEREGIGNELGLQYWRHLQIFSFFISVSDTIFLLLSLPLLALCPMPSHLLFPAPFLALQPFPLDVVL